jgi:hypothetical protein
MMWPVGMLRIRDNAPESENARATFCAPNPTINEK